MPSVMDRAHGEPKLHVAAEEPHYLIVLEGPFPSEPIDPVDPMDLPKALVGAYLMG